MRAVSIASDLGDDDKKDDKDAFRLDFKELSKKYKKENSTKIPFARSEFLYYCKIGDVFENNEKQ